MSQETAPPTAPDTALVEALREQVRQTQDQLHQAQEREHQAQLEKSRLLSLLEAEQQARRELEQKLLPPPPLPAPPGRVSGSRRSGTRRDRTTTLWWAPVGVLLVVVGALVWYFRDALLDWLLASLGG